MFRLLFLGDIVGEPGRKAVMRSLPELRQNLNLDLIIVNGENSAGGRGITPTIANKLFSSGADVITTGDHVWDQKEILDYFPTQPNIIRPLNYPKESPGKGSVIIETPKGPIAIMNLQGNTFMNPPLANPFLEVEKELQRIATHNVKMIFLDFHAETTSEKIAMGYHLDGHISAMAGTHTHVQTADERILPNGTAHITDAGMCGPEHSVLGRNVESVLWRFKSSMPTRFPIASGDVKLSGCIVEIDPSNGKAISITRYNEIVKPLSTGPDQNPS
ncbi:TIGR00282 family metallophosphoesterase [Akkermansiaceae bacterium]|nr:TIGR00282 family metallophosphoesterase [Akkermansiaceae bacterium]